MNYVIIGNSASGIAALEAIRECDKKGKITVVSDEPHLNYSRPLISYLLAKKVTLKAMAYRDKDFYKDNRVELILNKKAAKLDLEGKTVVLSDKRKMRFERLLIAAGSTPVMPEIKDSSLGGVFTFTKLSDAQNIAKYIQANRVKEAVIMGGGLIGLKAAEALIALNIKVTIIELADGILSATFDKKASGIIESALGKIGCKLITDNTVSEIKEKGGKVKEVILKDKKNIPTDLVIVAVGVKPNIELVKDTPIKTNQGILVNNFMRTNVLDIYAAGDLCEAKDSVFNINRSIAVWPVAVKEGKVAGFNMAGVKTEYRGSFAMNSVELCGIPTISMGEGCPEGKNRQVLEYLNKDRSIYKKVVLRDNKITGVIFLGDIERAGIYTGLIKDKIDVSSFKEYLLKEDFGLINLPKEYRKHLVAGEAAII